MPASPRPPCRTAGRERYKRNLALLVPFLLEPSIQLRSLRALPPPAPAGAQSISGGSCSGGGGEPLVAAAGQPQRRQGRQQGQQLARQLRAEWRLECYLRLPWRPYVGIEGSTTYTLSEERDRVGAGPAGVGVGCVRGWAGWVRRRAGAGAPSRPRSGPRHSPPAPSARRHPPDPCLSTLPHVPSNSLQIVSHVEAWEIGAVQALLLLLQPSERAWGRG